MSVIRQIRDLSVASERDDERIEGNGRNITYRLRLEPF